MTARSVWLGIGAMLTAGVMTGCGEETLTPGESERPAFATAATSSATGDAVQLLLDQANVALAAQGANHRIALAEYLGDGTELGAVIISRSLGNKRLAHDFVPNDPRRGWSGAPGGTTDDITYAIDATLDATPILGGLTAADTRAAILSGTASWEALACSNLPQVEVGNFGLDIGLVAFLNGLGGSPFIFADVQHAGFRDIDFAGGILGVTFTLIFIDGAGNPTDVNGDGRLDTALREIYYDASRTWRVNANIDVESVAVHEIGHGLSQAHFGNVFIRNDGTVDASPRAVMNALYLAPFQVLTGTDNAGHCGDWASWPVN
jgi:hypothetical protein